MADAGKLTGPVFADGGTAISNGSGGDALGAVLQLWSISDRVVRGALLKTLQVRVKSLVMLTLLLLLLTFTLIEPVINPSRISC